MIARVLVLLCVAVLLARTFPKAWNIDESDFPPLHAHGFSDEDIWDIASITAFFGLSNRLASFSGMQPNPEFYLMGRLPREKK